METGQIDPRTAIAMGRRARRQSQAKLAAALSEVTGEHWSRVMVGNLEAGRKELRVEILMAIARIQNLPYSFYLDDSNRFTGLQVSSPVLAVA